MTKKNIENINDNNEEKLKIKLLEISKDIFNSININLDIIFFIEEEKKLKEKLEEYKNNLRKLIENQNFLKIKELNLYKKIENIKKELEYYSKILNLLKDKIFLKEMFLNKEISNQEYKIENDDINNQIKKIIEEKKKNIDFGYKGDCILIMEGGEGGEESNLFTKELFESYIKYFNNNGIIYDIQKIIKSDKGGYKNIIVKLKGKGEKDAYTLMFLENGNHQVMRVPKTEKKGRIHTSIVKVKILPILEEIDIEINEKNIIKEGACKTGGKGGQNVNKRETGYKITYLLDNGEKILIDSREQRNQLQNKEEAFKRLKRRLFEIEQEKKLIKIKLMTKKGGNRNDKIRVYQFQNNIIRDERTNKKFTLEKILNNGNFQEIYNSILSNK